jgi:hypothetical protein
MQDSLSFYGVAQVEALAVITYLDLSLPEWTRRTLTVLSR